MPYYYFEAATAEGKIQKKILKARDKKDADSRLRGLGLHPMLIENARVAKRKKEQKALHTRRKPKQDPVDPQQLARVDLT